MNENIERKVDILISGMKLPKKKTRSRVVTIATSLLIAIAIIASASLINVYYVQTGTVDVKSYVTINGNPAGWEEGITIGGTGEAAFYEGSTDISDIYTITLDSNYPDPLGIRVYIHIEVTETLSNGESGDGLGLTVEVHNGDPPGSILQIDLAPGASQQFTIHVIADEHINAASTYTYTIKIDWNQPAP